MTPEPLETVPPSSNFHLWRDAQCEKITLHRFQRTCYAVWSGPLSNEHAFIELNLKIDSNSILTDQLYIVYKFMQNDSAFIFRPSDTSYCLVCYMMLVHSCVLCLWIISKICLSAWERGWIGFMWEIADAGVCAARVP